MRGEGMPFKAPLQPTPCAVCNTRGTVPYITSPAAPPSSFLAIDLCPTHFRDLLFHRLDSTSFHTLASWLAALSLSPSLVFLLHAAFYDKAGRAIRPIRIS